MSTVSSEVTFPYRGFSWVLGTTSFRTAQLNVRIEEQLTSLDGFYQGHVNSGLIWKWDSATQARFYDVLRTQGALTGTAARKDKDARQKTSGLVDLGFATSDRKLTPAARELLAAVDPKFPDVPNNFGVEADSYVYLKQLLKASITVDGRPVRPYLVLLKLLTKFGSLTTEEFELLAPLVIDQESLDVVTAGISSIREGALTVDQVLAQTLLAKPGIAQAKAYFMAHDPTPEVIMAVGMNRKSRSYDSAYVPVFELLEDIFLNGQDRTLELLEATAQLAKPRTYWNAVLFKARTTRTTARRQGRDALNPLSPFAGVTSLAELKSVFFDHLHQFKAKANLIEYEDLNRRYLRLSDTLIFQDATVRLDILPSVVFPQVMDILMPHAFAASSQLTEAVDLDQIFPGLAIDWAAVYRELSARLRQPIDSQTSARQAVRDERRERFESLLDTRFTEPVILELLGAFENRKDGRIRELVTDEASVPTIFEYIVAIAWHYLSGRTTNVLDAMNLSLDSNLLPRSHAAGGSADVVYSYAQDQDFSAHDLLIEVTLSDSSNQRPMEMEPVSRHLGEHLIRTGNHLDYCIFVATYLHINVISDFITRSRTPYYLSNGDFVAGMTIIPLSTAMLRLALEHNWTYHGLYSLFRSVHTQENAPHLWTQTLESALAIPQGSPL